MNFLYITDVFCPWCYGFLPVIRRLIKEYPSLPIRVLGGNLVERPQHLSEMLEEHPALMAFFERLEQTTGQTTACFRAALEAAPREASRDWIMHSAAMNLPLAALRRLAPGNALAQMEAFEEGFYARAQNVMIPQFWNSVAARWGIAPTALQAALQEKDVRLEAERDAREAEEIMGEFCLYPSLYLEREEQRILLARGYVPYETVHASLEKALASAQTAVPEGEACGLDGHCALGPVNTTLQCISNK